MGEVVPSHSNMVHLAECAGCGSREWLLELDPTQPGVVTGVICACEDCDTFVPLLSYVVDMTKEH